MKQVLSVSKQHHPMGSGNLIDRVRRIVTRARGIRSEEEHTRRAITMRKTKAQAEIGCDLSEVRRSAGLKVAQVAQSAGVTTAYLYEVESGTKWPTDRILDAYASCVELVQPQT